MYLIEISIPKKHLKQQKIISFFYISIKSAIYNVLLYKNTFFFRILVSIFFFSFQSL